VGGTTLTALLERIGKEHGPRVALVESESGRRLTFEELREAAGALAADVRARGVRRGDVVALWLPNVAEYLVWELALAALGAAGLGVNTRYGQHEVSHLLERAAPVGFVVQYRFLHLDLAGTLAAAVRGTAGAAAPWVAVVGAPAGADVDGFDVGGGAHREPDLDRLPTGVRLPDDGRPDDHVVYFTTSGSTGAPKLPGHPQSAVVEHAENVARSFDMRAGDALHLALPLCGVFGFSAALGMLAAGGSCVLEPTFDPDRMSRDIVEHGVTHLVGGDDMLGRLMVSWLADPVAWPTCRRGAIANFAGKATEVARWAQERHGIALSGVYGSSELFALVSAWPAEMPVDERVRAGGVPVSPGIEVRAVDPASGDVCPAGTTGELQFRGYPVTTGYLGGPAVPVDADGWFASGDLGSTTDEGAFLYLCRAGDALRLHGFLVEPAEIESFLMAQDGVDTAKVVGADAGSGTVAVAFVTRRPGAAVTATELHDRCRDALAGFKVPARIEVLEAFPVTTGTNGTKIRTSELRARAARLLR
jgi:fatty-acyl-CoA synthase